MSQKPKYLYAVFKTKWGFFGLIYTEKGVFRTSLPVGGRGEAKSILLFGIENACFQSNLNRDLQEKIMAYFAGKHIDLSMTQLDLGGLTAFSQEVLTACKRISYGQTVSYKELAGSAHRLGAGRAVGNILAKNPIPLIIPCHRVIRSDGQVGGFMGGKIGGAKLKQRLIQLEEAF